jgi:hypothetical protein
MSTSREIFDHVTAKPFQPFRIHMSSGRTFDVRHPEMVQVGVNCITIYAIKEAAPENSRHWHKVCLMLIESLEPIEIPSRRTDG